MNSVIVDYKISTYGPSLSFLAGGAAPDWCSSMGEGLWPGVQHPHHRRGDRRGRFPVAHRHRGPGGRCTPPPGHAILRILLKLWP